MNVFQDSARRLDDFADEFLVECPRCSKVCVVTIEEAANKLSVLFLPRKAVCVHCGYLSKWNEKSIAQYTDGRDWYFGLPLWLKVSCCGEVLWAFNERHLDYLEAYIGATIRKEVPNVNSSMASRLPAWINC